MHTSGSELGMKLNQQPLFDDHLVSGKDIASQELAVNTNIHATTYTGIYKN